MNGKAIGYWVSTGILVFVWVSGGIALLAQRRENIEGMMQLGYPLYIATILGAWKLLGAAAIVVPRFPRLKEWAYAGTFFELTGAMASHVANGDGAAHIAAPAVFLICAMASWALRPDTRKLPAAAVVV